jgi:hypothetical protein
MSGKRVVLIAWASKKRPYASPASELVEKGDAWLNPPDISAKELNKRTLTSFDNDCRTSLQLAHKK